MPGVYVFCHDNWFIKHEGLSILCSVLQVSMLVHCIRERPCDMDGLPAGAVRDLVPATGAVGHDYHIVFGRADRRQDIQPTNAVFDSSYGTG